jgi:hypothetical protein
LVFDLFRSKLVLNLIAYETSETCLPVSRYLYGAASRIVRFKKFFIFNELKNNSMGAMTKIKRK